MRLGPVEIRRLNPGDRIRITQTVRIGKRQWPAVITGTVREVQVLLSGLTVCRAQDDQVTILTIHFTKDNGELSSVAVDENSRIEVIG